MVILIIAIILGIIIVVSIVKTYNRVAGMKVKIEESQSDMETYLIKRYDVLTESVKAIGSFKQHEEEIMKEIIKPHSNMTDKELKEALESQDKAINQIYNKLFYGCNLPAMKESEPDFMPKWTDDEKKLLLKIINNGLNILTESLNVV